MMPNIVAFAPMPSAKVAITATANPGERAICRSAYSTSCRSASSLSDIVSISSRRRAAAWRLRRISENGPNNRCASAVAASGDQPRATSCATRISM